MDRKREIYIRRMIISAVLAVMVHVIGIPMLGGLKEGEGESVVFAIRMDDSTLAALPTVAQEGAPMASFPPPSHGPVGLSSSLIPVPRSEADEIAPEDTNRLQTPFTNTVVGANTSQYTPEQDSAFARGQRLHITPGVRFRGDVAHTDSAWEQEKKRRDNTPEAIIQRNLAATDQELQPTQRDMMQHAQQYTPGAPQNISPNIPRVGVTIPFSMGRILGYEEDVSATVEYTLQSPAFVHITIFSVHGDTVAQPFVGIQHAGKHTFTWDATNEQGNRVAAGDYIAEIVIGDTRRILKHIVVA